MATGITDVNYIREFRAIGGQDLPTPFARPRIAWVLGDSILGGGWSSSNAITIVGAGNRAYATWTGNPLLPGGSVLIYGANETAFNGWKTVSGIGSNLFTFDSTSKFPDVATGTITAVMQHRPNDRNFLHIANASLGCPLEKIYCGAIPGLNSAQVLAAFNTLMPPEMPDLAWIQVGTNDIRGDVAMATIKSNILSLVTRCQDLGMRVVLCTIPPGSDATATVGWTVGNHIPLANVLNRWIRKKCKELPGVEICDTHSSLVDPTSATNAYGTVNSVSKGATDLIHPSGAGAQVVAINAAQKTLLRFFPGWSLTQRENRFIHSVTDSAAVNAVNDQILTNPLMTGTQANPGTGTGNTPTGWTGNKGGTATNLCSVSSRSDGFGQNLVMTITPTAANDYGECVSTTFHSLLSAGDEIDFEVEVNGSTLNLLDNIEVALDLTIGGASYFVRAMNRAGQLPGWQNTFTGVFRPTLPWTVPSGVSITNAQLRVRATFTGNAAASVINVGCAAVIKKPA